MLFLLNSECENLKDEACNLSVLNQDLGRQGAKLHLDTQIYKEHAIAPKYFCLFIGCAFAKVPFTTASLSPGYPVFFHHKQLTSQD